jgi:2-polyprenyl-3-methyl-5-hydroxy-6-metoxy-1,4-benzoquinol methylase
VPVLQNVIIETKEAATTFPTGELLIVACDTCSFIWNAAFNVNNIDYGRNYNNSVQASAAYLAHQNAMAKKIISQKEHLNYLEIGCGAGEFIQLLEKSSKLVTATGFDPVFNAQHALRPHITVHAEYFTSATASKVPDTVNIICSRHTIEHIPNPRDFIRYIAAFVKQRGIKLFLETPDVNWILKSIAFEDLFYEHCSLFSPSSMRYLLAEFGLSCSIESVYGGQYMWIEAESADIQSKAEAVDVDLVNGFTNNLGKNLAEWTTRTRQMSREGPLAIWGGASKGVTFSLLMNAIDCTIDLNTAKQGGFLPVSAKPITSPQEAKSMGVKNIIVMNPNYETEIRSMILEMSWDTKLHSLHMIHDSIDISRIGSPIH